jgi:hypothetical protein
MEDGDVGMIERSQQPGFPLETGEPLRISRELGGQDLERDLTPELGVVGAIDDTHPSLAEFIDDAIVGERPVYHFRSLRCAVILSPFAWRSGSPSTNVRSRTHPLTGHLIEGRAVFGERYGIG